MHTSNPPLTTTTTPPPPQLSADLTLPALVLPVPDELPAEVDVDAGEHGGAGTGGGGRLSPAGRLLPAAGTVGSATAPTRRRRSYAQRPEQRPESAGKAEEGSVGGRWSVGRGKGGWRGVVECITIKPNLDQAEATYSMYAHSQCLN